MTRRWLIDLPTRLHLWAAEQEIRRRSSSDPERLRNLDVLRDYRKGREFPRNDTDLRSTPYFVDREGRHCAVGQLMRMSGDEDAVRRIAAGANLARIDDMDPALLTDWTERSGLTKRELARIQPNYANGSQWAVNLLLWTALLMIPLALLSFGLGRISLDRTTLRRNLIVAAVILCTVLSNVFMALSREAADTEPSLLESALWYVVMLGPIIATATIRVLVRNLMVAADAVASIGGVITGSVMTACAGVYLVLDVVVPDPTDPSSGAPGMSSDHPVLWSPPAFVGLVIGVLTLTWAVRSFGRLESRA